MKNIFLKYWLPVIVWAAVIFYFSHQPHLKSDLPGMWDFVLRKIAHVSEYFILTLLLIRALYSRQAKTGDFNKMVLLAVFLSIFYATTDEFHQSFVLGRNPALKDVCFDAAGALLAAALYYFKKIGLFFKKC